VWSQYNNEQGSLEIRSISSKKEHNKAQHSLRNKGLLLVDRLLEGSGNKILKWEGTIPKWYNKL
jgi:hypothetical protein